MIDRIFKYFDQYAGVWIGFIIVNTTIMAWVEVFTERFITPEWWVSPTGIVFFILGTLVVKTTTGYFINSKYNSKQGEQP